MEPLKKYRSTAPAVADLLRWATLAANGVVTTKNGEILGGFYFRPPDSASTTDEMQLSIATKIAEGMMMFGTGWATWTDVVNIESNTYPAASDCFFPDWVSRAVDEERRQQFESEGAHYENERVMIVSYTPPHHTVNRLDRMIYSDETGEKPTEFAQIHEAFEKKLVEFEDKCGRHIGLRRMQSYAVTDDFGRRHLYDELVNYLAYTVSGEAFPCALPAAGAYLDCVIAGGQALTPGERPMLDDCYLSCITIEGFPAEAFPNIVAALNTMGLPYRFSQRAIFLDGHDAIPVQKTYKRKWRQKSVGMGAMLGIKGLQRDDYALRMHDDCVEAISLAESGTVRYLYYSAVVVLRHHDLRELGEMERFVRSAVNDCGFKARIESTNTVEAWRGSLAGDTICNVRRPLIHTTNLADILPLSGVWTGSPTAPCPKYPPPAPALMHAATVGNIPFRFNLHVRDVGHTLIFGPTGAGKSTLLVLILLQALRYRHMQIWAFDYKRGLYASTKACGGNHFELGAKGSPQLCPLGVMDTEDDLIWCSDWIETAYELQTGKKLQPEQRTQVRNALLRLKDRPGKRSMTDFVLLCQDMPVKEALRYYTTGGDAGFLLDSREDGITASHFNVFETIDLMALDERAHLPTILYMFRRFERSLDGRPTILLLDEAWKPLSHPVWREKIFNWLKILRSKNCAVIMATQSLSDAARSSILDVLIESCPTKVYLPNEEALKTGMGSALGPNDFYRAMGLNDNQIGIIFKADRQKEYYVVTPEGCRLIDLALGPFTLAFAGATSEDDASMIRNDYVAQYGEGEWVIPFLKKKGVDYESYL